MFSTLKSDSATWARIASVWSQFVCSLSNGETLHHTLFAPSWHL